MSKYDITAIVLMLVVAVVLVGVVLYFGYTTGILRDLWDRFVEWNANRAERAQDRRQQQQQFEEARLRQNQIGVEIPLPPEFVVDRAVEAVTRAGYSLESRTPTSAGFVKEEGANFCLGCFLTFLFVLPGILYLYMARITRRVSLSAYPTEGDCRVVIGGDDRSGIARAMGWAQRLAVDPDSLGTPAEDETPASPDVSLARRIRELSELKESGLITEEEYEAKRRDLLDRM